VSEIPKISIETSNGSFELLPSNSSVYLHLARTALDHIWYETELDEDGTAQGIRFFREVFGEEDQFNTIAGLMIENEYEAHISIREVSQSDMDAYVRFSTGDVDGVPKDWV
jgi:hypothetical protein